MFSPLAQPSLVLNKAPCPDPRPAFPIGELEASSWSYQRGVWWYASQLVVAYSQPNANPPVCITLLELPHSTSVSETNMLVSKNPNAKPKVCGHFACVMPNTSSNVSQWNMAVLCHIHIGFTLGMLISY